MKQKCTVLSLLLLLFEQTRFLFTNAFCFADASVKQSFRSSRPKFISQNYLINLIVEFYMKAQVLYAQLRYC